MFGYLVENILFNLPYDEERYEKTLEVCALTNDLKILEDGDEAEIGERGVRAACTSQSQTDDTPNFPLGKPVRWPESASLLGSCSVFSCLHLTARRCSFGRYVLQP